MNLSPIIRDVQSRVPFALDLKTDLQRHLRRLRKRSFEYEYSILKHLEPNGKCAVDIGANRGQSIEAIRLYHPNIEIHSFEPNRILHEKLIKRYNADNALILRNMAIGSQQAFETLYVPYYRKFMYDGLASFTKERATNWLNSETVWRFNKNNLSLLELECNVARLDAYNLNPFFLKIHVQGFEKEVLVGGENCVQNAKPVLLLAYNAEAHKWLVERGWQKFLYHNERLKALKKPDPDIYNCTYLHPDNSEHVSLINKLGDDLPQL